MRIFDLTCGRHTAVYDPYNIKTCNESLRKYFNDFIAEFPDSSKPIDFDAALGEIPVFIVESTMSGEYVSVPGMECLVRVPYHRGTYTDSDNGWLTDEGYPQKDDRRERRTQPGSILELLGAYIYKGEGAFVSRRIFIWIDKIEQEAVRRTRFNFNNEIRKNTSALFYLVLCHEMAHAMMDVELYGVNPDPKFTYMDSRMYRFIEEAHANAIALRCMYGPSEGVRIPHFIEDFVNDQPEGYSAGWNLYHMTDIGERFLVRRGFVMCRIYRVKSWMRIKTDFAEWIVELRDFGKSNDFIDLENCYEVIK